MPPTQLEEPFMTRPSALVAAVALTVASAVALAQDKPNFAGKWTIVGQPAEPMVAPQMTVTQDAKTLTITATTQMGEIKTPYNLDGTENKSPIQIQGNSID